MSHELSCETFPGLQSDSTIIHVTGDGNLSSSLGRSFALGATKANLDPFLLSG